MPESRTRKKAKPARPAVVHPAEARTNPTWYVPLFVALLVIGLAWVVITYITDSRWPIPAFGAWNLAVGFGFILVGFGMTMRWK